MLLRNLRWLMIAVTLAGCTPTVKVEVAPIHMTLDVNLKVQRDLDNFFDFEQKAPAPATAPAASNPAAATTQPNH